MSRSEEELDALVADLDEAEVIDVIEDATGGKLTVGRLRDAALIGVKDPPAILDTPELRDRFALAYAEACRRADGEPPAVFGEVRCDAIVGGEDDDEEGPRPCGSLSRFIVSRSDRDASFGAQGGSDEACEGHLAEAVAGMVEGDEAIRAIVTIRWDPS